MPLNPSKLYDPIFKLFTECSDSPLKTATIMSDAYADYASDALFIPAIPIFTGIEKTLMKATILAVLPPFLMNPAGLGTAWAAGVSAYWLAPPVLNLMGLCVACPGAPSLVGIITAICIIPGQPAEIAATGITVAVHAATLTTLAKVGKDIVPIS